MAQIASVDYANLRINLHVDTVTAGFDPALMQQEYRALRRLTEANRRYDPMVSFAGNESKGGGKFTPRQTLLRSNVRIVPFDQPHSLSILNEILNIPDGLADVGVFDRSTVTSNVDIDPVYGAVEVIQVSTGSGLSTAQDASLTFIENQMTNIHNGWNLDSVMRLVLGVNCGKISGPPPGQAGTVIIRDPADTKNLMEMPVDANGYRIGPAVYDPTP